MLSTSELPKPVVLALKILGVLLCLYLFLVGVSGMGDAFKMFGKDFAERTLAMTSHPVTGLFIGILATSIVQSSSTTTSIIVGMVGGGAISLEGAIPMVMGANIGTTLTAVLVSLGHINRPQEFERAFGSAILHVTFNLLAVAILFPLQEIFGVLTHGATFLSSLFQNVGGMEISDPLSAATEPTIKLLLFLLFDNAILLLVATILLTFAMLYCIVKLLRSLVLKRLEAFFDRYLFLNWRRAMIFGLLLTMAVQSSSISTTLVVPLAGAGVLRLIQIYPFNLGANVGTTITGLLAALATANPLALTVAFSHVLFNICGILFIWAIPPMRNIPLFFAEKIGARSSKYRALPFLFIALLYFVIPLIFILIFR